MHILEIFTDYICPWCYLADFQMNKVISETNIRTKYTFFPLHPNTPAGGLTLQELFAGRGVDVAANQDLIREQMVDAGLPYGVRTHTYNSRAAQELGKWAEQKGRGAEFRQQMFRAYFVGGSNIADERVLAGVCEAAGLGAVNISEVLDESEHRSAVDADWLRCRQLGVRGVPCFLYEGRWLTGCQSPDALKQLIRVE